MSVVEDRNVALGASAGRRKRRRKWTRAPQPLRQAAIGTLGDLFASTPARTWMLRVVLASLAAHALLLPLVLSQREGNLGASAGEDTYLSKVLQKERAKLTGRKLANRVTMPPPPADPEAFVAKAMDESLTTDIKNVIGNLLDVSVSSKIAQRVSASLKDELDAAAQKIAEMKLTEEEIRDLQEQFRQKAHQAALTALAEHRIETQVERAAMSTTQWYEEKVSRVLFTNLKHEMYGRPSWDPGPRIWYTTWSGGNGAPQWHQLSSLEVLQRKLRYLEEALSGRIGIQKDPKTGQYLRDEAGREKWLLHESWPGPNVEQARFLKARIDPIYNRSMGGYHNQEVMPSWSDYFYSGRWSYGLIDEFYPHRQQELLAAGVKVDELWRRAFEELELYSRLAEDGGSPEELRPAQEAFFATGKLLAEECRKLFPDARLAQACAAINESILIDLLGDGELQKQHWQRWVDKMEKSLSTLILNYADGQFNEGIIKRDGSIEQAMRDFAEQMKPLVRRDVLRLLPREKFDTLIFYPYQYRSKVTEDRSPPATEDYQRVHKAMADALVRFPELEPYARRRRELVAQHFADAVTYVVQVTRKHIFARGLLTRNIDVLAEGVDYSDKVQEKLDARKAAKDGRGQDLARLTAEGLPDTGARMVALQYGLGHGGLVEPVACPEQPGFAPACLPAEGAQAQPPQMPPLPAKWGTETQPPAHSPFEDSPAYEGIPFLSKFPRLDGDLSDWGRIRPLVLCAGGEGNDPRQEPILLYAAWNYQGFFFGYKVRRPAEQFYYPEQYRARADTFASWERGGKGGTFTGVISTVKEQGYAWMLKGDYLRLLVDTLDARSPTRGDPHTQEFVILPMGTDTDPSMPGLERMIQSRRDAAQTEWRQPVTNGKIFLRQPPADHGPDGTGPYRVTKMDKDGPLDRQSYTVEAFLPRSLFNTPVFAPGWHIGFDAAVATGLQSRGFRGQYWSPRQDAVPRTGADGLCPRKWGDLLLLGTDPFIAVQNIDSQGSQARGIIPGHSYLLTVIDPDRNIYATQKDSVLVSAEVAGKDRDIEVFMLMETEPNSGIFRGYINTQPGGGRQVQGVLEALPLQEVRFGYVDIGTADGKRNAVFELKLPVLAPLARPSDQANGRNGGAE